VPVHLPPLRERLEDVPLLVADFLRNHPLAREKGINRLSERALEQLLSYPWPGNVRELLNVLERAVLRAKADTVREVDIPVDVGSKATRRSGADFHAPLREFLRRAERDYLNHVLARYHGGIGPSARHAMIDQATLHRKIKSHGLRAVEFRAEGRSEAEGGAV
jgi:DNA-binding NtrC family response regulator